MQAIMHVFAIGKRSVTDRMGSLAPRETDSNSFRRDSQMSLKNPAVSSMSTRLRPTRWEVASLLSGFTRYLGCRWGIRGGATRLLRRYYAAHHRARPGRSVEIPDYDGNLRMRVDRAGDLGSRIYWFGYISRSEIALLRRILKPDMVFVDVGANAGAFSLFAANRLTAGIVLAFEPVPTLFRQLCHNVAVNKFRNVVTRNTGLGDRPGQFRIYLNETLPGTDTYSEGLASMYRKCEQTTPTTLITVERLDDVFSEMNCARLDVLKIDVEGAELFVLRGAQESILRYRPLIMIELNAETFATAGYGVQEVIDMLEQLGYKLYLIRRRPHLLPLDIRSIPPVCNVLARADT